MAPAAFVIPDCGGYASILGATPQQGMDLFRSTENRRHRHHVRADLLDLGLRADLLLIEAFNEDAGIGSLPNS